MNKSRLVVLLACLLTMIGCDGPVGLPGPVGTSGPQGEQGIDGAAGSGTRLVARGVLDVSGSATLDLPPELGTISDPPLVGCYVSPDGSEWFVIGAGPTIAHLQCLLKAGEDGNVQILIRSSQPESFGGKGYLVVAVY